MKTYNSSKEVKPRNISPLKGYDGIYSQYLSSPVLPDLDYFIGVHEYNEGTNRYLIVDADEKEHNYTPKRGIKGYAYIRFNGKDYYFMTLDKPIRGNFKYLPFYREREHLVCCENINFRVTLLDIENKFSHLIVRY